VPSNRLLFTQMSPDRGHETYRPATMQDDYFSQRKSLESQAHGYSIACMKDAVVPEAEIHSRFDSHERQTHHRTSHNTNFRSKDGTTIPDLSSLPKYTAVSVRSMSSTENSRRDSAISAESQHRRRPKTSRSNSKRSLQSANAPQLSRTVSRNGPQRPRGHRFGSSTSIHVPHTNIEEALALHARSCEIFSGASRPSTAYNTPATSPYGSYLHHGHYRSLSSADALPISRYPTQQASPYHAGANTSTWNVNDEDDQYFSTSFPPTTMHWTSDEVRMKEYEAIDRSNSGVRGFLKKLLPKCVSRGHGKFYDGKDGSDAGSVRRIRLDVPVDKDEPKISAMPRQFAMA